MVIDTETDPLGSVSHGAETLLSILFVDSALLISFILRFLLFLSGVNSSLLAGKRERERSRANINILIFIGFEPETYGVNWSE